MVSYSVRRLSLDASALSACALRRPAPLGFEQFPPRGWVGISTPVAGQTARGNRQNLPLDTTTRVAQHRAMLGGIQEPILRHPRSVQCMLARKNQLPISMKWAHVKKPFPVSLQILMLVWVTASGRLNILASSPMVTVSRTTPIVLSWPTNFPRRVLQTKTDVSSTVAWENCSAWSESSSASKRRTPADACEARLYSAPIRPRTFVRRAEHSLGDM